MYIVPPSIPIETHAAWFKDFSHRNVVAHNLLQDFFLHSATNIAISLFDAI
jgi:hypothetical protein